MHPSHGPLAPLLAPLVIGALALALVACDRAPGDQAAAPAGGAVQELDWDALIPPDWRPEALLGDLNLDDISDEDPEAIDAMEKLKALWAEAPVVEALDGKRVRIPGFVVPLDLEPGKISEFLLVPYYGACIHVPPPPANQTIFVRMPEGQPLEGEMFDTIWVEGTLKVTPTQSELAEAGYLIEASTVTPYEGDVEPM
jgi:hypothetical protein